MSTVVPFPIIARTRPRPVSVPTITPGDSARERHQRDLLEWTSRALRDLGSEGTLQQIDEIRRMLGSRP